ncbi:MAG: hypothetical protein JSS83_27840 [Cyanobacteria bacterium SZAS LIN-3]|nr:hypothetical protein [Cyanobacteria bacterium SZAS LIN-3]
MSGNLKLLTAALAASLTVGAASASPMSFGGSNKAAATPVKEVSTPELDAAGLKCDQLKAKFDQAKKQLEAAKANLKAAEAELKAARADREALSLRTQARELASAAAVDPIVKGPTTNGLGAVSADAPQIHDVQATATPLPGGNDAPPTLQDLAPANIP